MLRWESVLLVLGLVAILFGCLVPLTWLPRLPNDKFLHFIAFGGLGFLAGRLASTPAHVVLALLAVFACSWVIELLQNLVPGRKFCWRDMVANACGILCAGACLSLA